VTHSRVIAPKWTFEGLLKSQLTCESEELISEGFSVSESLSSGFSSYPFAESSSSEYLTMDGAGLGGALEPLIMAKLEEADAVRVAPLELACAAAWSLSLWCVLREDVERIVPPPRPCVVPSNKFGHVSSNRVNSYSKKMSELNWSSNSESSRWT
jgi:hypothetical protein